MTGKTLGHYRVTAKPGEGGMGDEARIYSRGPWEEITRHGALAGLLFSLPFKICFLGLFILAFFLVGMLCARRRMFIEVGDGDLSSYRRGLVGGVLGGLLLVIISAGVRPLVMRFPLLAPVFWIGTMGGTLLQGLGYGAGVALFIRGRPGTLIARSLEAVGRMALSNYLLQSVLLGGIFYASGLGLFMRLTASAVLTLALPVFIAQAGISMAWLRYCSMGPIEWAWRSLSYGRVLALLRP